MTENFERQVGVADRSKDESNHLFDSPFGSANSIHGPEIDIRPSEEKAESLMKDVERLKIAIKFKNQNKEVDKDLKQVLIDLQDNVINHKFTEYQKVLDKVPPAAIKFADRLKEIDKLVEANEGIHIKDHETATNLLSQITGISKSSLSSINTSKSQQQIVGITTLLQEEGEDITQVMQNGVIQSLFKEKILDDLLTHNLNIYEADRNQDIQRSMAILAKLNLDLDTFTEVMNRKFSAGGDEVKNAIAQYVKNKEKNAEIKAMPEIDVKPKAEAAIVKEVLNKPDAKSNIPKSPLAEVVEEAGKVMNGIERDNKNPEKTLKIGLTKALEAITLYGDTDETKVLAIFRRYVGDSESGQIKNYEDAIKERIRSKKEEILYFDNLRKKAEEKYEQDPSIRGTLKKEEYADRAIAKFLVTEVVTKNPANMHLTPTELNTKIQQLQRAIESGEITLSTPAFLADGVETRTSPILTVKNQDLMDQIASEQNPDLQINAKIFNMESKDAKFNIIAIKENKDGDTDTLKHELTHLIMGSERDLLKDKIRNQVKNSLAPKMVGRFEKIMLEGTGRFDSDQQIILNDVFNKLLSNPKLQIEDLNELSNENKALAKEFMDFCKESPEGKKAFDRIYKVYDKINKEFDSPLEEAITKFTDMFDLNRKIGMKDIFGNDKERNYNPEATNAATALIRSMNMIYADGTTEDKQFFRDHKDKFIQLIRDHMVDHTSMTMGAFVDMIHQLRKESEDGDINAGQILDKLVNSDKLIERLQDKSRPNFIRIADNTRQAIINFEMNFDADALAIAIENEFNFSPGIREKILLNLKNGNIDDALLYISFGLPTSDSEETGQYTGGEFSKASSIGANAYYRKMFDNHPRVGGWMAKNGEGFKNTWLEAVPFVGGIAQNFIDSFTPNSRTDIHFKDIGPFGDYSEWLSQKNLRDLGFGVDPKLTNIDGTDWFDGFEAMTGISINRNTWLKNKIRKIDFLGITKDKDAYMPNAITQPNLPTYHSVTLKMIGEALSKVGISSKQNMLMFSVIGGIDVGPGQIDADIQDWDKIDEYRMNDQFSEFIPILAERFDKSESWKNLWMERFKKDSLIVYDANGAETSVDISTEEMKDKFQVMKGTMTTQLMNDISESIFLHEDQDSDKMYKMNADSKRVNFEKIAKAMMTTDYERRSGGKKRGYTMRDLAQLIIAADNDVKLKHNIFAKDAQGQAALEYMNNPRIKIPGSDEEVDLIYAKEFITHYYLARLRTISSVGIWGMVPEGMSEDQYNQQKAAIEGSDLDPSMKARYMQQLDGEYNSPEENRQPCASIPNRKDRKYNIDVKRKLSDTDDSSRMQMTSMDLVESFDIIDDNTLEYLCGTQGLEKGKKFVTAIREDSAHDQVTGVLWANREGKQLAYKFTAKLRQAEAFRAMSKAKKAQWEGLNNLDDNLRFLILVGSLATLLVPGLGWAFAPNVLIGLLGWSLTASPFINRGFKGWSQREKAAIEATGTLLGQYSETFFNLAKDAPHSPNDIGAASQAYENVKNVYKSVIVNLSKHGDPDSNYVVKRSKQLMDSVFGS